MEDFPTLVIDSGEETTKYGIAGEKQPKFFNTVSIKTNDKYILGEEVKDQKGEIINPIERGIIKNFECIEKQYNYIIEKEKINTSETTILLPLASQTDKKTKEKLLELMFEKFGFKNFYQCPTSVLSLYSAGKISGVVVDSGYGATYLVPVDNGFEITENVVKMNYSGKDINEFLCKELFEKKIDLKNNLKLVSEIKEKCCEVCLKDINEEIKDFKTFELPDGNKISLGKERFNCTEVFFNPKLNNINMNGIPEIVLSIIKKSPKIQKSLFSGIVIAGGSSLFKGFDERIEKELIKLSPNDKPKVVINTNPLRKDFSWTGGSILGSLIQFQKLVISKDEFKEFGSEIVHKVKKAN